MKRTLRRILAGVLSAALVIPMCSTGTSGSTAEAAEVLQLRRETDFISSMNCHWKNTCME